MEEAGFFYVAGQGVAKKVGFDRVGRGLKPRGGAGPGWGKLFLNWCHPPIHSVHSGILISKKIVFKAQNASFGKWFLCAFNLKIWVMSIWVLKRILPKKKVNFVQLQELPFLLTARFCSVTKWWDSSIKYQRSKFQWKNGTKFSHLLIIRAEGAGL